MDGPAKIAAFILTAGILWIFLPPILLGISMPSLIDNVRVGAISPLNALVVIVVPALAGLVVMRVLERRIVEERRRKKETEP